MKVLYLSPSGALGGAEKVLLSVMKGVRQARPDMVLHLLALAAGPLIERARQLGAEVTILPLPPQLESMGDSRFAGAAGRGASLLGILGQALKGLGNAWKYLRKFRQELRRIGPDLIHSNGIKTHCLLWGARPSKVPIVWHVHDFFGSRPLARQLLRLASRRIAGAIAISQAVAADFRSIGCRAPVQVIPNTMDVHEYTPASGDGKLLDQLAGMHPIEPPCLRVGLIASYARWKGHAVFLEAAARLAKSHPDVAVRFYVIGGPIYQTQGSQFSPGELQELACQLGVNHEVGFIGFQENVVPIYQALDVVVHASTAPEPFGMTIIEAMACGKPVIATLAGGVAEIITPGQDALGIPMGDVTALASAMQSLVENPALRLSLARNAREVICRRFNQDRLGFDVINAYYEKGLQPIIP